MAHAKPDALFLHCLPADRGYEVTAEVIDGPQSRHLGRGREPPARAEGAHGLAARAESGRRMAERRPNEGSLWGARFSDGPSPELAPLEPLDPLRLAARRLRHRGLARARARARRGRLSHRRRAEADARGPRRARGTLGGRTPAAARPDDEDVHGALEAALIDARRRRARRPAARRPQPQRPDRHAHPAVPARPRRASIAARVRRRSSTRSSRRPRRIPTPSCPGRTHLQHAQPVLLAHHLLAHAWPLVRDLERLRDWAARAAIRSPYGAGALAGSASGSTPRSSRASSGFGRPDRELDRRAPPAAMSSPSSPSSPRRSASTSRASPRRSSSGTRASSAS